jgi:hypothetical protein
MHPLHCSLPRLASLLCLALAAWRASPMPPQLRRQAAEPRDPDAGLNLAQRTAQALEAEYQKNGSQVCCWPGRAGPEQYDLQYSHYGWAYRTPEGPWRVAHKLNSAALMAISTARDWASSF